MSRGDEMNNIKIFRVMNSVIIVENGVKKIINTPSIIEKDDEEIIRIHNERKVKCNE